MRIKVRRIGPALYAPVITTNGNPVDTRIGNGVIARRIQRQPPRAPENHVQDPAVRYHDDGVPGMFTDQFVNAAQDARLMLPPAFSARRGEIRVACFEGTGILDVIAENLFQRQPFATAEVSFAQRRIVPYFKPRASPTGWAVCLARNRSLQ